MRSARESHVGPGVSEPIGPHVEDTLSLTPSEGPRPWILLLTIVVPYWCYISLWRLVMYSLVYAASPTDPPIPSLTSVFATDFLLLPPLLIFCRIALSISVTRRRLWWLVPLHFALGLLFAALRNPALTVATYLIDHGPTFSAWWQQVLENPRPNLYLWAGLAVQYIVAYTTSVGLLGAFLLYRRWRTAEEQRARLKSITIRARLQALRMQLNPHFLFNALHLASGLVDVDSSGAKEVISRLGSFLRRVLDEHDREQISLGEELQFLEDYLAIQYARFGARLSCSIQADAGTRDALVPPLVLQPLIENAVKHGMGAHDATVYLEVSAKADADWLDITLTNATAGGGVPVPAGLGIGLKNLRERLSALYGEFARFEDTTLPNGRYIAHLRIPFETSAVT